MQTKAKAKLESIQAAPANMKRGLLFASAVTPAGIIAWVVLWQMGFIASLVAFGVAYGATWLYKKGSGEQKISKAAYPLLALIIATIVLAFLAGMISDGWSVYSSDGHGDFWSADFWSFIAANFSSGDLWSQYLGDIFMSLVFGAIGAGGVIMELARKQNSN
jgi:hypothetical protein